MREPSSLALTAVIAVLVAYLAITRTDVQDDPADLHTEAAEHVSVAP